MEDVTSKISLYHNLFIGCLILSIVCLIVAIVLFFVLDIRHVLGYLTGRSAKKQIQELEQNNAASGRLVPRERTNMQYVAKEMKEDMGIRGGSITPGARKVEKAVQSAGPHTQEIFRSAIKSADMGDKNNSETSLLQNGESETSLLSSGGEQETSLLSTPGSSETSLLTPDMMQNVTNQNDSTAMLQNTAVKIGSFFIEREVMLVHTEEVIQ